MGFSRQECWSGLPHPTPRDLPDPGIKPTSLCLLHWQVGSWPLASPGKPAVVHTWWQNEDSTRKWSVKFSDVTYTWEYRCVLQLLDIHFLLKNPFPELSPYMSVTDSSLETHTNFSLGFQSCLPPFSHTQLPGSPFYWTYPGRISPVLKSFNGSHCLSKSSKFLSMAYATFTAGFWLTSPSCQLSSLLSPAFLPPHKHPNLELLWPTHRLLSSHCKSWVSHQAPEKQGTVFNTLFISTFLNTHNTCEVDIAVFIYGS